MAISFDDHAARPPARTGSSPVSVISRRMATLAGPASRAVAEPGLGGKLGVILAEVEHRLATGRYRFGEEIRNADLVSEFRASRAPVTMALNLLRTKGYLVIRPQVGVWVVSPSRIEVQQFFHLLSRAEAIHASSAAEHATLEQVRLLQATQAVIAALPCTQGAPRNLDRFELVGLFHDQIRMMAGISWLTRQTASVWNMSNFLLSNMAPTQSRRRLQRENRKRLALIDAIKRHDSERAAATMEEYIGTRGNV